MRIIAGVLLASLTLPAPDAVPAAPQIVRIDVIAADGRGRVIDSLKPSDFELRDEGVARALDDVRFVRPGPDEARVFALFLDEYHVSADATDRVRTAAARFLAEQIRPNDLVVVMKPLDSVFAIHPTTDRTAATQAIQSFEGRRGLYEPRNAYERNFIAGVPARIDAARNQVVLSALNALAVHFGGYPDQRKTLIVVSEGVTRTERRRGMEYLPTAETIRRSAQRGNVAIYAINPGAAGATDGDVLAGLTTDTAGQAFDSEVDAGFRRATEDAAAYYLLTYRAARPDDGKYHPVEVRVKRSGAQLRARAGYFSPSPDDTLRAALLAKAANPTPPPPPEPAPHVSPLIRPWFGTSRGANGKTRVTIVWEPTVRTIERVRRVPTRVKVVALTSDNTVAFEGVVLPTGAGAIDEAIGPFARATFDVPPGRVRLRMAILDAAQTVIDTDVRSINIRDMAAGVTIATPEVLRARTAREFRALDSAQAVPVASREFSRTERLFIRFQAYAPSGSRVSVTARLLSRMGPMRDLTVEGGQGDSADRRAIDVPLAGLAAGEYVIEVSASGPAGEAKDVIDFRVTT